MEDYLNYIALAATLVVVPLLFLLLRKGFKISEKNIFKCFSLLLSIVFFIRYFAVDGSLYNFTLKLTFYTPFASGFLSFIVLIAVWLSFASVILLTMFPFFNFSVLKNYVKTLCLVSSVFSVAFLQQMTFTFTANYGFSLCGIFLAIEVGISLLYSFYVFMTNEKFKIEKKEVIEMLWLLPIVLLFSAPPYLFRSLVGPVGAGLVKGLSLYHRIYIYLTFIFLFAIYFFLRNKNREYCRMVLLFISLAGLVCYCYNQDFSNFIRPTSWPLHLCNTAMFIIPVCLMFRLEKLFYFTLFINVLGAFFAILMPNYNGLEDFLYHGNVKFWVNHICAFAMPVLIILLNIYERPKLKFFTYSMVGFAIYFGFILIINAWFTNFDADVDFFFVNSDFIAEKLGHWAEQLRDITWTIDVGELKLIFYPIYQILFFLVYVFMGLGMWFLYVFLFQIQDFYINLRQKRKKIKQDEIALCVKYGQKEVNGCMNKESENKLVVKHVSKRYGNNKKYSVKDASFEVDGGEILGFLGPNGAGKSTIIKCIVGIQPATKGSIEINGYDIDKQPVMAKSQFGFVPDHYALYEKLTGREYINYIADLYEVSQEDRDERLNKLLSDLNMTKSIDNQIRTYSHGMKQKITIMSALIHNPKLWILDEPLTGLDPNSIYEVKECMKEHAKKGNIVFFSSHIIDIVEKLCNRIIIIKNGRIRVTITLDELKEKGVSLEQFYLNIINAEDEDVDMRYEEEKLQDENAEESKFFAKKENKKEKRKQNKKRIKKQKENYLKQNDPYLMAKNVSIEFGKKE